MTSSTITLVPLGKHQRETFIRDLQAAFSVAVIEESGKQKGEIIPREEVAQSLDQPGAEAFQLMPDRKAAGGAVVTADRAAGRWSPDLLYLRQFCHNRGLGLVSGGRGVGERHAVFSKTKNPLLRQQVRLQNRGILSFPPPGPVGI